MKVTVIGASCIDIICKGASKEVFETGHQFVDKTMMSFGGDGLNEAVILKRLGLDVDFITVLGNDDAGNNIYNYCQNEGINIIPSYKSNTYMSVILVDESGQRNLLGTKDGSLRQLCNDDIKFPLNGEIVSFASLFISKKMNEKDYEILFEKIKNENKILVVDSTTIKNNETVDQYSNVLNKIDFFIPNDKEAMMFTRCDNVVDSAELLFDKGVKNVIIKCGDKGCYIKNNNISKFIPAVISNCIDTTGAGDSFVSGLILGLSIGLDIEKCLELANKCGGKCIEHIGATSWTKEYIKGI